MTVKELVEELEQVPEDIPVCVVSKFPSYVSVHEPDVVWAMDGERIVKVVLA